MTGTEIRLRAFKLHRMAIIAFAAGDIAMEWNRIEAKWYEMAKRLQGAQPSVRTRHDTAADTSAQSNALASNSVSSTAKDGKSARVVI
ncbi:hypothetical protein [Cypionkella aquatica]|uniref:hypothetical protein n=1 Tax=Cypionkella aquatica TaxID=1756042 RepID=UPI0024E0963E|nr:hypothetical protein [Cypionkella aquatica]